MLGLPSRLKLLGSACDSVLLEGTPLVRDATLLQQRRGRGWKAPLASGFAWLRFEVERRLTRHSSRLHRQGVALRPDILPIPILACCSAPEFAGTGRSQRPTRIGLRQTLP